jgi:hypothetical protein
VSSHGLAELSDTGQQPIASPAQSAAANGNVLAELLEVGSDTQRPVARNLWLRYRGSRNVWLRVS